MEAIEPRWRKSSYSGNGGGNCVEVASLEDGMIAVRDSKNPDGTVLMFEAGAWQAFLSGVRAGQSGT